VPKSASQDGLCVLKRKNAKCCDDYNCTFLEKHFCPYEKYLAEKCPFVRREILMETLNLNSTLKEQIWILRARLEAEEDTSVS